MIDRTHASPMERLFRGVAVNGRGCMEWSGSKNPKGYGRIKVDGRCVLTHRLSWELHNGVAPHGMHVCHSCDNPACVNPDHLFIGTNQDNVDDRVRKGRSSSNAGTKNGRAKLTEDHVRIIRASERGASDLAREFGVTPSAVCAARHGRNWRAEA